MPVASPDLRSELDRVFGGAVARLERRPSLYRTSFFLEELEVTLEDGTTLPLIFKDLGRHALSESARGAKPDFLYEPLREIEVYESVLAENGLGTPTCYGTVAEPELGRYWLFLEKVPGAELYQVGELETWCGVARWLALLHERCRRAGAESLIAYDADFYRLWLERARRFTRRTELDRLGPHYDEVVERLVALPATFIHGEFYASNVLVQETGGGLRVRPVDWEMAAVGPGLMGLAALTAGRWTEEEKAVLALAYHYALAPGSKWRGSPKEFLAGLECCCLHLAVQWLGWSPEWSPPAAHAQDWLGEALFLAEKLEL
jgi:hypothetical protein